MSKHLTDKDIQNIVSLLDGWDIDRKLTWDKLLGLVLKKLKLEISLPTIKKQRVRKAFEDKKNAIKSGQEKLKLPASLSIAAKIIETLENKNSRLEKEQESLLTQFVVWQYNAYANGVTVEQLNRAMPAKSTK